MTEQEKLIGKHPSPPDLFGKWLTFSDVQPTLQNKKHRKLDEIVALKEEAVKQIGDWIIKHHLKESKLQYLEKKKAIYDKYGFKEFLEKQKVLPTEEDQKTQKGNCAEVILSEYLQKTNNYTPHIYKLRYNPNVHQSIKGDDVLLFNSLDPKKGIILAESKFRKTPSKDAIEEILESLGGNVKLPISVTFVSGVLRDMDEDELADTLDDLQAEMYEDKVPVINVGFLMSNLNVHGHVERHDLYGNYSITDDTIAELKKINFPCEEIEEIKEKVYKTETLLDKGVKAYLDKRGVTLTREDWEEVKRVLLGHCVKSCNKDLVFVTLAIDDPEEVIVNAFKRANECLLELNNSSKGEPAPN